MDQNRKVVMVTDADSSIGEACIRRMADAGARLIVNSESNGERIRESLAYCHDIGADIRVTCIQLHSSRQVNQRLAEICPAFGEIDVLVHNNHNVQSMTIEDGDEAMFHELMDTNVKSAFICTQAVGRRMAKRKSGRVIFIGSIHDEKPTGSSFAYSAAQGALKMLSKEAALELGRHGIQVNLIELGPFEGDDERFQSNISTIYDSYRYKIPRARTGSKEELADLVHFLASDQANYLNGADIRMDGGFVLHYMNHKMKKPQ